MDLVQRDANRGDTAFERRRCAIAVLVAPRAHAFLRLLRIMRTIRRQRVLDDAQEPVLGAAHVLQHIAERPLALPRYPVQILVEQTGERAGQVAVGVVVLAKDALASEGGVGRIAASRTERSRSS